MGDNKFSTGIAKGYRIKNNIVGIENRESGLGQTTQTSLWVPVIATPPIKDFHGINVNCGRKFYLQPGSGIISMREGSCVVVNGITGRKLISESGGLSCGSR